MKVIWADKLAEAFRRIAEQPVDVILLDLSLPDASGLEVLERMQSVAVNVPIVVLTGSNDEALALQAVRSDAQDYLLKKHLDGYILARVLRYAIERKRSDMFLRNALLKERELNELKSRFVSMVSHDFRTPMAIIRSSSDLLSHFSDRMTAEKQAQHFTTIDLHLKRLTTLLEEVLTLTKAELVGLEFKPIFSDLQACCQVVTEEMQQLAGTREIKLTVVGQITPFEIDTNLLRRALLNLLSNAVKYSPEGSIIEFTVSSDIEQIVLCIQDRGIGIPEEEQCRLFEVFHRAKNVGNVSGTGLGLAIVKLAVEAHGGTITIESQVNVGTAVTISIPVSRHEI